MIVAKSGTLSHKDRSSCWPPKSQNINFTWLILIFPTAEKKNTQWIFLKKWTAYMCRKVHLSYLVRFLSIFAAGYSTQNNFSSDNKCKQIIQGILHSQISFTLWALPIESKQNCIRNLNINFWAYFKLIFLLHVL